MPWHWTSSLRLHLGLKDCRVVRWSAGWSPRIEAEALGQGGDRIALHAALDALQLADDMPWGPQRAELILADEHLLHSLVQAEHAEMARERVLQTLRRDTGHGDWSVFLCGLPQAAGSSGSQWLAAACPNTDVRRWHAELAARQITVTRVRSALMLEWSDLLVQAHGTAHAVGAWVREEGLTLMRLHEGVPVAVTWEPLDPEDEPALHQRLRAFVDDPAAGTAPGLVLLHTASGAWCRWRAEARPALQKKRTRPEVGLERPEPSTGIGSVRGNRKLRAAV